jgi:NitT/TauT family transport system ATP-binding protein
MSKVQTAVTHAVELDQVVVRFRSKKTNITAFREVSLRVVEAEFVTIVGPSGCGKSTLLKLASGLLQPSNGDVWLRGDAVTEPRRDVGYVFQCAVLLDWRAARRNMLLQGEMRRMLPRTGRAADRRTDRDGRPSPASRTHTRTSYPIGCSSEWRSAVRCCTGRGLPPDPPQLDVHLLPGQRIEGAERLFHQQERCCS